ncbi:MAG: type II toxin-antitoxin system VapC family toxin [Candidatus Bathyarchaeota archaeon]|nr:type II toxin-antitoxin system VapC family toxin [Candidatus Bathyarchaeota archaeon]MDD4325636.1 type II toxin-antitoxin system VapC family toxin [Candidatus Bathyarchaeota archaeon]MDT8782270.1 type II toxin-antitoxin system VapC family toxin [Candidatus Bathyarchaeota archaeon]
MPYLDSNVFIYPVLYNLESEPKAQKAQDILFSVEAGELEAYTSTLTWDEVVWVVSKTMGRSEAVNVGKKLLGFPNLKLIDVDALVVCSAQRLIEKNKINPRDAIHVACALEKKITDIISDDSELDVIKEIHRIPL